MKKYLLALTILICHLPLQAEVVTDGTLGAATSLPGPEYLINDSLGQQLGKNLFHSFKTFDINTGEIATFTGPDSIANILTRITGGNRSFIDGTIRSKIPNANLYLLNPNGILFGENANLDIQGSFHASTADYLRLGKTGHFSASYPEQSLLTVAPPQAFGFLDNPNAITVQGSYLRVPTTKTLSIVSGEIQITDGESKAATLYAPDGRINLIAVDSMGEVIPTHYELATFEKLGRITLSHFWGKRRVNNELSDRLISKIPEIKNSTLPTVLKEMLLDIFNEPVEYANVDVSGDGGGQIFIRAGDFSLTKSWIFADTYGDKDNTSIDIFVDGDMNLFDNARITMTNMMGSSNNDDLKIKTTKSLTLTSPNPNFQSIISTTNLYGIGKGGNIYIDTPQLLINSSRIEAATFSEGKAGSINIDAQQVKLQGEKNINIPVGINTATAGNSQAGDITINATDIISLSNVSSISSASYPSNSREEGNAGNISLNTNDLKLNYGEINTFNYGAGNAGSVDIIANTASFTNSNLISENPDSIAGDVSIQINRLLFADNTWMMSLSEGMKPKDKGGKITIKKPQFFVLNTSKLDTTANKGSDGQIIVDADYFIQSSDSTLEGEILINSADENFSDSLVILTKTLADASRLIAKSCVESMQDDSYFVETARIPDADIEDLLTNPQPPSFQAGLPKAKILAIYQSLQKQLATTNTRQPEILSQLAALYAYEHRYPEALQLNKQALTALELLSAPYWHYKLQWQKGRLFKALGQRNDAIIAYKTAVQKLAKIRSHLTKIYRERYPNGKRSEFREVLKPIFTELVALLLEQSEQLPDNPTRKNELLKIALQYMDKLKTAELQDYFQDDCTKPTIDLEQVEPLHTAIIYPIFLPNSVKLLVSLPKGKRLHQTIPATPQQLTKTINTLATLLHCQTKDCQENHSYRASAQQLYDWLLRPLEPELSENIHTLVFVPDGPLYSIPMAVLHDGNQFLIEKYALAITPNLTQPSSENEPRFSPRMLYSALTESNHPTFAPIQHYATPMQEAIEQFFGTVTTLKGQNFVSSRLEQSLNRNPYTMLHIFSHAKFSEQVQDTFVVTFNDKLNMKQLEDLISPKQYSEVPLDLLTLSACETAKGDERAALGLAGVAYKAGTHSAIATLWAVDEDVAFYFFQIFYNEFAKHSNKARAVQTAQLKLLNNSSNWQHPYYWSPFLLIGNWL